MISIKKKNYCIIPILAILAIVPIIVYLKIDTLDYQTYLHWRGTKSEIDLFAYYKVLFTMQMTAILSIIYLASRKNIKRLTDIKEYKLICLYFLCIIISFMLSEYKEIALFGFIYRYEGSILLISYLLILFITINIFNYENDYKKVLSALAIGYIIVAIVGISQYLDSDIVTKEFMQRLIIPDKYSQMIGTLRGSSKANQKVAGLIGNANYFAEYFALICPLFIALFIYSKEKKEKIIYGILGILGISMSIISLSETAMISIFIVLIILLIINIKNIVNVIGVKKIKIIASIFIFILTAECLLKGPIYNKVTFIVDKFKYEFTAAEEKNNLQNIELNGNKAKINYRDREVNLECDKDNLIVRDENNKIIYSEENISKKNKIKDLKSNQIIIGIKKHKYTERNIVYIRIGESIQFRMIIDDGKFKIINNAEKIIEQDNIKIAFGEGKEELLTGRLYIWSRTIPKIIERPLFGYGADTFELVFPNHDYVGLYKAYNRNRIIVDKPHNLYLGIALNTGIISLMAFLAINIIYLKDAIISIKKYGIRGKRDAYKLGILLSVISYLMLGIMYDSNIVSTSIYYILLGIGINLNYSEKERTKQEI